MKRIALIALLIYGIWLATHPQSRARLQSYVAIAKELGSELRSATVEEPIAKAKSDFIKSAEQRSKEEAEAHFKEIDKAIEQIENSKANTEH